MASLKVTMHFDNFIKLFLNKWLAKNIPADKSISLNHKNTFIFPSRFGIGYLISCIMLYFVAANYQNNLIFFLLYFLLSFMLTCLFLSYQNIAGLKVTGASGQNQFVDQDCMFTLRVNYQKNNKPEQINFRFKDSNAKLGPVITEQQVLLYANSTQRGYFNPGRVTISSNFPCGLFNVWTHVDLKLSCILFPSPVEDVISLATSTGESKGDEEFSSLREYQQGESLKSVAWKQVAQGRGWYSKQFETPVTSNVTLELSNFENVPIEKALSKLCYLVLALDKQSINYALNLGTEIVSLGSGESHKQACLQALALYRRE